MVNNDLVYKAIELLKETTNSKKDNKDIYYYLGKYYYSQSQYEQVLELIDKAIALASNNNKLLFLKGLSLYNLNKLKDAEQCFKSLINTDKEEKALYYLGLIEYDNSNYFMSLIYLTHAKDKYGIDKDNYLYYSIKLVNLKIKDIKTYLTLRKYKFHFTKTKEAYELKAIVRIEKGNYSDAMDTIKEGLKVYLKDSRLLTQKVICLYHLKRYSTCLAKGEKILSNKSITLKIKHKINLYLYMGYSHLHLKNETEAKAYFRDYLQMERNQFKKDDLIINECKIMMKLNMNFNGMEAQLNEVFFRNPNNIKAIIALFNVYMKESKHQLMNLLYDKVKVLLNKDIPEHKTIIDYYEFNYKLDEAKFTENPTKDNSTSSLINDNVPNTYYDSNYSVNQKKKLNGIVNIKVASDKFDSDVDSDINLNDKSDLVSTDTNSHFSKRHKEKTVVSEAITKAKYSAIQSLDLNTQIEDIKKNVISNLNHPNLCIKYCQEKMEIYDNLYSLLYVEKIQFSDKDKHGIICQIAKALEFLHSYNIQHGYVNTKNILIDQSHVTESGIYSRAELLLLSSIFSNSQTKEYLDDYTPPEYETEEKEMDKNTLKGDVYSFGVVIYKILTNEEYPFPKYKDKIKEIIENKFELKEIDESLEFRSSFVEVIKNCCFINKNFRPKMQTLVKDLSFLFDSFNKDY